MGRPERSPFRKSGPEERVRPKLTISLAVYNHPRDLLLALAAGKRQSMKEFEPIVADDRSGPELREVIAQARKKSFLPVIHLWRKDSGWRKNVMLKNAIRSAAHD
jgi:glycosyltransferase involved in cell wall biosynthesis